MRYSVAKIEQTFAYASDVTPRDDTRSTNQSGADVRDDRAVQVWHDHYVELPGTSHELHRTVEFRPK